MKDMNNPLIYIGITFVLTIIGIIFEKEYKNIKETQSKVSYKIKKFISSNWKIFVLLIIPMIYLNILFFTNLLDPNVGDNIISVVFSILLIIMGVSTIMTDKYNPIITKQNLKIDYLDKRLIEYSVFQNDFIEEKKIMEIKKQKELDKYYEPFDKKIKEIQEIHDKLEGGMTKEKFKSEIDRINSIQDKEINERKGINKRVEDLENENRKFTESIEKKNRLILKQQEEINKSKLPFVMRIKSVEDLEKDF